MRTTTLNRLENEARRWNALYPVGTPVEYWPGARGHLPPERGHVRAPAQIMSDHLSAWVTGLAGSIALSHVQPLTRIRCLTLWQPWASAMAHGLKTIETRSYPAEKLGLRPGDLIGIHAAARRMTVEDALPGVRTGLIDLEPKVPYSAVLCVVRYLESKSTGLNPYNPEPEWMSTLSPAERALGDYSPGRFGWRTEMVMRFEEPIPVKGHQGAWNWDVPPQALEQLLRENL